MYMVQAMVRIKERTNRVLNVLKAKYDLRDKSEAIDIMAEQYEENILEPELRPEYIKKLEKIRKGKYIKYNSIEELRKVTK
ncbi:MAG TPA: DUF2683 family protein [Candidatus Nanoarchaeia archaeon]|nr:DUF2683 family protein [Candidatus Nanoarchaeia archaeon]